MKHQDIETLPQVSQVKLDLIAARALIVDENKWCQIHLLHIHPEHGEQLCSAGALRKTLSRDGFRLSNAAFVLSSSMNGGIGTYNDCHTHAEVMRAWDKAIVEA